MKSIVRRHPGKKSALIAAAAFAALPVAASKAATVTWNNATPPGLWSNAANWTGGSGVPTSADAVVFGATGSATTQGTLTNEVDQNFTLSSLTYAQQSDAAPQQFHTTQIDNGITLSVTGTGSVIVGNINNTTTAYSVYTTLTGLGTFAVNNTGGTFSVRQGSVAGSFTGRATLDMSGLSTFTANLSKFEIGVGGSSSTNFNRAAGTVILGGNSTITAGTVSVGTASGSGPAASQLTFGNAATINANTIEFGTRKATGNANFAAGVTNGSIVVRNQAGTGRATLNIGQAQASEATTTNAGGTLDFTGDGGVTRGTGSLDFLLSTLAIGRGNSQAGTATQGRSVARLSYEAGTVDANDVTVGEAGGAAGKGTTTGTLEVKGAGTLVVNNNLTLAQNSVGATTTGIPNGVLTIGNSGSTAVAKITGDLLDGGGNSTINVTDGTLKASHIGLAANPIDTFTVSGAKLGMNIGAVAGSSVNALTANGTNVITPNVSGNVTPGTYVLLDYGSIAGGGFGAFTLGKLPPRMAATLVDNAGNTSIDLNVTSFDAPKWTGNGDKTWNTSSTNNWQLINGGTPTTYQEDLVTYSSADNVTFDDSTANGNVTINATVSPNSITVTNSSTAYTFGGTGAIAGSPSLTKTGSSSLTFKNTGGNTLGAVSIGSGSTVTVGDGVTTGVGFSAGSIANAGTLQINRPDNGTISAAISGAGNVSHTGAGTTTLSGASSYTGTTDISNGTVKITAINNLGATGTGAGQVNISGTGTLDIGDAAANSLSFPATKVFHLSGGGFGGNGTIINSAPDTATRPQTTAFNKITLDADATIGGSGRFDIRNNSAVLDLAGHTLTKKGTGQFSIVGTTVNDGNIDVQGGTLSIETTSTVGGSGTITYEAGSTGQFFRPTGTVSRPMVVNGATLTDASQTNTVNITSPLTFGGSNSFAINSSTGFTFSGNINETVSSSVTKNGAGTMVLGGTLGYTGTTTVNAGKLILNNSLPASAGISVTGGTLQMAANQMHAIKTASVSVTGTGKLDINDNKLITTAQGVGSWNGTAYDGLTGQIAAGYSANQDFSGNGVVTSQTTATGGNTLNNIGVASNADLGYSTFGGVSVGANDTLAMYTYGGDANLDGMITGDDYFQIDSAFPQGGHGWFNGDFNYDGAITGDDYFIIDSNFPAQGAAIPTSGGVASATSGVAGVQAVPEPASIGVIAMGATALLARRRRRNGSQ